VTLPVRRAARACATARLASALALAGVLCGCATPQIVVLEDPLGAEEHVALGVAYEHRGELEAAAREYERALKKDRASFRARLNLGNVRLAQKRYHDARGEYRRALEVTPGNAEATNNLAWAAILSGNGYDEALQRLDAVLAVRAAALPPADGLTPVLLDTRGVLLGRLGRLAEAEEALAEAETACLDERSASATAAGPATPAPPCPESVLDEIRGHRAELRSPAPR
jgi:tetratricopeptide (TPR) repeat protein